MFFLHRLDRLQLDYILIGLRQQTRKEGRDGMKIRGEEIDLRFNGTALSLGQKKISGRGCRTPEMSDRKHMLLFSSQLQGESID